MRYKNGSVIVLGDPSIAWINEMYELGMIFTLKDGQIIAEIEVR